MATPAATTRNPDASPPTGSSPTGLSGPFDEAAKALAESVDATVPEVRGRLIHQYLKSNGFFSDPARAQAYYDQSSAVDAYLDEISLTQASSGGAPRKGQGVRPSTAAAFAGGAAAGVAAMLVLGAMG